MPHHHLCRVDCEGCDHPGPLPIPEHVWEWNGTKNELTPAAWGEGEREERKGGVTVMSEVTASVQCTSLHKPMTLITTPMVSQHTNELGTHQYLVQVIMFM